MSEGTVFKLWKDEDHPEQPVHTDEPVVAQEEVAVEEPQIEPEIPATTEEPVTEQPEVVAQAIDIDKEIENRLGRPVSEIQKELDRIAKLEQLAVEDEELLLDDEFLKNFTRAYKRGGKKVAEEYIEAISKDFSKLSPEQLVEYSVQKRLNGAPKSVIEKEFRLELEKMGYSEDLEPGTPEYQRYTEYLAWKSGELREGFIKEQQSFKIPERQKQEQPVQAIDQEAIARYERELRTNPDTLGLVAAKSVTFGDFQLAVEPDELVTQALDTQVFFQQFSKPDGTPDYGKFYSLAAIAKVGPQKFAEMVAKDAAAKERLKWVKDIKNPSTEPKPAVDNAPFTVKLM